MIMPECKPFIKQFLKDVSNEMEKIDKNFKLSAIQIAWLAFCITGILVTGTFCWAKFERYSLGRYSIAALSWMFRKSNIVWSWLFSSAVLVILKKYDIKKGHLLIDDSDHQRSKSTNSIAHVHKIFDKKTAGYFMGQNIVFLLFVSETITIPVGFKFYKPDPKKQAWNKEDERLRSQHVPKSKRPPQPPEDPNFPSKITIAHQLISDFQTHFPEITITSASADAAYGSSNFFTEVNQTYPNVQTISQLKSNQNVLYKGMWKPISEVMDAMTPLISTLTIRGRSSQQVQYVAARLKVQSHGVKRLIVAIKYETETEYRYVMASNLSWKAKDVLQAYSLRWLVEVFIQDWKGNEGWGQLALQQGVEGADRGVLLSLLVDLCLLFHPNQFSRIKNKQSACTVGSLREQIKNESLLACFQEVLLSENPMENFSILKEKFSQFFIERSSTKHLSGSQIEDFQPSESLARKFKAANLVLAEA